MVLLFCLCEDILRVDVDTWATLAPLSLPFCLSSHEASCLDPVLVAFPLLGEVAGLMPGPSLVSRVEVWVRGIVSVSICDLEWNENVAQLLKAEGSCARSTVPAHRTSYPLASPEPLGPLSVGRLQVHMY